MLKSAIIYGGILAIAIVLRLVLVAVVSRLEENLKNSNKPSPFFIPLILSILVFISGVLTVAQFVAPVLWIVSKWNVASAVILALSILIAVFVGTYMTFVALKEFTLYGTKKKLNVIVAVLYFLYMDWFINLACSTFTTQLELTEMVRMGMNVSIFAVYVVFLIVLLVKSLKVFPD